MSKPAVLIAYDEPITLETTRLRLSRSGFHAFTTSNGDEALALAQEHRPHAILIGLSLNGLEGVEVCRRLRLGDHPSAILFMAPMGERRDIEHALDAGADDFLLLPASPAHLQNRLDGLLQWQQPGALKPETLSLGNGTFLPSEQRVDGPDGSTALTLMESALLQFLQEHPDAYFSVSEIFERVWTPSPRFGNLTGAFVAMAHLARLDDELTTVGLDASLKLLKGHAFRRSRP